MIGGDQPQPVVLAGGLHVPGGYCGVLVVALETLETLLGGQHVPLGCRRPGLSRAQQQLLDRARAAAAGYEQQRHRALAVSASGNPPTPCEQRVSASGSGGFGDLAETPPPSPAVITTSGAVVLAGRTARRWRQLAAQGSITATQDGRRWLLDRHEVLQYGREVSR